MTSTHSQGPADRRPLGLRRRPDLVCQPLPLAGRKHWAVKDPVARRYFLLTDPEYLVLDALDGRRSLAEVKLLFERQYAPRELPLARLQAFLGRLHEQGLVLVERPGQAQPLADRRRARRWTQLASLAVGWLSLRFRGIDPHAWLNRLVPTGGPLLRPAWVLAYLVLLALGGAAAWASRQQWQGDWTQWQAWLSPSTLLLLAVVLFAVKLAHELGHAVVYHRLGGQCHELGVMLLVGVPCLYCDVSDAWLMPQRWKRLAVSAAGMAVELALAAAAALVVWATPPGPVHTAAWSVVLISSIGTLLINGNPLVRYDGYFLLSDWAGVPNLGSRAAASLERVAARLILGSEPPTQALETDDPWWLPLYALASIGYRCLLLVGVWWLLAPWTQAWQGEWLLAAMLGATAVGWVGPAAARWARWITRPDRPLPLRPWRAGLGLAAAGLGLAALLVWPWPQRFAVPVVIEPVGSQRLYATVAGRLQVEVTAGQQVVSGTRLARLENADEQRQLVELEGQVAVQRRQVESLLRLRGTDPIAAAQLPAAQQSARELAAQLAQRRADQERWTLRATQDGQVMARSIEPQRPGIDDLPTATGTWLDPVNQSAELAAGDWIGWVGDPRRLEAWAYVDQAVIERVAVGQIADLRLEAVPASRLQGRVVEVGQTPTTVAPAELVYRRELPAEPWGDRQWQTLQPTYLVRIAFECEPGSVRPGGVGQAKIRVGTEPWSRRLWRALWQSLSFREPG